MEVPNTIIITLPTPVRDKIPIPHRPLLLTEVSRMNNIVRSSAENMQSKSRKRKLENLSVEEKILNKKMKNRVAAQNSRDKKKARMDQLEAILEQVKHQNEQILDECRRLRLENESLRKENIELREKDNKSLSETSDLKVIASRGTHESEPAAFFSRNPLQKGRDPRLAMAWQAWCCVWGLLLLTSPMESHQHQNLKLKKLLATLKPVLIATSKSSNKKLNAQRRWWGPQQSNWNPVKLLK